MADYIQIEFEELSNEQKDIIIALLSEMNYEGFEEEGDMLKAYISSDLFDENELKDLVDIHHLFFTISRIENRNWNKEWESNFQPVVVDHPTLHTHWVAVRAGFHESIKNVEHEIIITPKMSFGTGHHATTSMMMQMMSEINFKEKKVLDFGTGTGILAILSEKLGASTIVAIDNDEQSIENAKENIDLNHCSSIQLILDSSVNGNKKYDIILANIIKKVIFENLQSFAEQLSPNGVILLSGLLKDDKNEIITGAEENNLVLKQEMKRQDWLCLKFEYNKY